MGALEAFKVQRPMPKRPSVLTDVLGFRSLLLWIPRKLAVREPGTAIDILIRADFWRCQEILAAARRDDVVLIDAVTRYADRTYEVAVAIQRETSGENRDPIWKVGVSWKWRSAFALVYQRALAKTHRLLKTKQRAV